MAVAARDLSRAKEFAKKHDIPKAYGSYEELAKDPDVGEWPGRGGGEGASTGALPSGCSVVEARLCAISQSL